MTNSADPDELASEANWSGSTLFAKTGHDVFSKRRVGSSAKPLDHLTDNRNWPFKIANKVIVNVFS